VKVNKLVVTDGHMDLLLSFLPGISLLKFLLYKLVVLLSLETELLLNQIPKAPQFLNNLLECFSIAVFQNLISILLLWMVHRLAILSKLNVSDVLNLLDHLSLLNCYRV